MLETMARHDDRHGDDISCTICKKTMRCNNYARHMKQHLNQLLGNTNCMKAIENKHPVVSYKEVGPMKSRTRFAYCFVCNEHQGSEGAKECLWRYQHERWCKECKKPHPGKITGETVLDASTQCMCSHMPPLQNTKGNKVDDFITKHNVECRGGFDTVRNIFDAGKVPPKPRGIRNSKDARAPRKTLQTHATRVVVDDRTPRDAIARRFPNMFERYFYDAEDDRENGEDEENIECWSEERDEQRCMTQEEMLDKVAKALNKAETDVEKQYVAIEKKLTMRFQNTLNQRQKEYDALESETIRLRGEVAAQRY